MEYRIDDFNRGEYEHLLEGKEIEPLYAFKETLETIGGFFQDQIQIVKESDRVSRKENWTRYKDNPLQLRVRENEVIAIVSYEMFIYNQYAKPPYDKNLSSLDQKWDSRDSYTLFEGKRVVRLPKAYDTFNLEPYKNNTYQKLDLDQFSFPSQEKQYRVPPQNRGRSKSRQIVKEYQIYFYLFWALLSYTSDNESLEGEKEETIPVDKFLLENLSTYFDTEAFSYISPEEFNPIAPSLENVENYIEQYELPNEIIDETFY